MSVQDKIKEIVNYKSNKLKEIQELKDKQKEVEKELTEYLNTEISKIESAFNISSSDADAKCKFYCSIRCISPCELCSPLGMCTQCTYGYCSLVERLIRRYDIKELESYKEKCPYALIAYIKKC